MADPLSSLAEALAALRAAQQILQGRHKSRVGRLKLRELRGEVDVLWRNSNLTGDALEVILKTLEIYGEALIALNQALAERADTDGGTEASDDTGGEGE
ncbi:MAG: hypothetical protein FWD95_01965 [Nocardioidaceae bacterium]|nr:hypothetical protein [Nocardioidaceae bacterium]